MAADIPPKALNPIGNGAAEPWRESGAAGEWITLGSKAWHPVSQQPCKAVSVWAQGTWAL